MTPRPDPERDDGNSPGAQVVPAAAFGVIDAAGSAPVVSFAGFGPASGSNEQVSRVANLHGRPSRDTAPVADFASVRNAGTTSPMAPGVATFESQPIESQPIESAATVRTARFDPSRSRHRVGRDGADRDGADRDGADRDGAAARRGSGAGGQRGRGGLGRPAQLDPDADPVAAAKDICLRLLTDRSRTRLELAQALRRRGVPDDVAETVLSRFDEVGLIDDAAFAGQWVRARHTHRGLARRAIAMELRRKGVDDEVAGEALATVDAGSEDRRARELVDRKLRTVPAGTPEQRITAARRLVGMLARKGYGGAVAYRTVREALAAHGAADDLPTEVGEEINDDA